MSLQSLGSTFCSTYTIKRNSVCVSALIPPKLLTGEHETWDDWPTLRGEGYNEVGDVILTDVLKLAFLDGGKQVIARTKVSMQLTNLKQFYSFGN